MKTLLVTGCAGFIGANFCHSYGDDFIIVGVDGLVRGGHEKNVSPKTKFHKVDITSEGEMEEIFNGFKVDAIVNFAAESHVDHSLDDDSLFWSTNVMGVRCLAKQAIRRKIRLLQVSTDEVYGHSTTEVPFHETDILSPRNPYAASKAAAELLLKSYVKSYGLDCVVTRGSNTIGPYQALDKAVPKAISHFMRGLPFPLFKTPAKRMWLDVQDHCAAIRLVLEEGNAGETYNISPDASHEWETEKVMGRIAEEMSCGKIERVEDRLGYDLRYLISSEKIRAELKWRPKVSLDETLRRTIKWYRENLDWFSFQGSGRKQ